MAVLAALTGRDPTRDPHTEEPLPLRPQDAVLGDGVWAALVALRQQDARAKLGMGWSITRDGGALEPATLRRATHELARTIAWFAHCPAPTWWPRFRSVRT